MAHQYTLDLSPADAAALCSKLRQRAGYEESERPYASFCFEGPRVNVAYYPKRKRLLIQGSGSDEFLEFVMLVNPGEGVIHDSGKREALLDSTPHFGIDESGKGDYFGPLVIAGVYSDEHTAGQLLKLGCRDSKAIHDDKRIHTIAEKIKTLPGIAWEIICIGPHRYNDLYAEFGNLNRLLAWGHARVIAALHEKVPTCPRALSDQFAKEWVLKSALNKRHIPVSLEQRTGGESDIAVAAASILARDRFVHWVQQTAHAAGCELPLGCAPHVTKAARVFVQKHGAEKLKDVAKLHFKVTGKVLGGLL